MTRLVSFYLTWNKKPLYSCAISVGQLLQSLVALDTADPTIIAYQLQLIASISTFLECDIALLSQMLQKVVYLVGYPSDALCLICS